MSLQKRPRGFSDPQDKLMPQDESRPEKELRPEEESRLEDESRLEEESPIVAKLRSRIKDIQTQIKACKERQKELNKWEKRIVSGLSI